MTRAPGFTPERAAKASALAAGRGDAGTARLAYAGASTHVLVGVLAREVRRVHPGIEFPLNSQDFALPALARVLRGDVDISLGRWDCVPAGIQSASSWRNTSWWPSGIPRLASRGRNPHGGTGR